MRGSQLLRALGGLGLMGGLLLGLSQTAGATGVTNTIGGGGPGATIGFIAPSQAPSICTGTPSAPGQLSGGSYGSGVVIDGTCWVNGGVANISGNLTIDPGSELNATFAMNDQTGVGASALNVAGNVYVGQGATVELGCEPEASPCSDNPNVASRDTVSGSVYASEALGMIVHDSVISGDVLQVGGGGGLTCEPMGAFAAMHSPVFSNYEDNTIGGDLTVAGLQTCYIGALRNQVGGSLNYSANRSADPDSSEVASNQIGGGMYCSSNSPAVQFGDSHGSPNMVGGGAVGECAFGVSQPNPAPNGPETAVSVSG
ncbi:MAG: hypothetical protein ACRDVP_12640 [Acidimicrobiales bacterium]